jgi:hypothetical protein
MRKKSLPSYQKVKGMHDEMQKVTKRLFKVLYRNKTKQHIKSLFDRFLITLQSYFESCAVKYRFDNFDNQTPNDTIKNRTPFKTLQEDVERLEKWTEGIGATTLEGMEYFHERPKLILNYMNENESLEKHELNDDAIQSFRNWEAPEFDEAVQSFRNAVQNVNKLLEIDVKYRDLKDAFKILKQDFGTSSTTADKVSFLIGTAPSVSENDKIKMRKNIKFAFEFHDTKQPLQILIASLEQYTFNCINGEDFTTLKNIFTMDIDSS